MAKETDKKKTAAKTAEKKPAKAAEKKTTAKKADDKKAAKTAEKKVAEKKPAEKKPAAKKADTSKLDALIKAAVADGKITDAERKVLEKRAKEEGFDKDELNMLLDAKLPSKIKESDKEEKKGGFLSSLFSKKSSDKKTEEKKTEKFKDHFEDIMVSVKGGSYIHYWTTDYEYQPKDKRKKPVKLFKLESKTIKIDDFKICKYPVTQALWKKIMGEDNNPSFFRGDNLPVDSVSIELVNLFLNKLNSLTGKNYRLPMLHESLWAATGTQLTEFGSYLQKGFTTGESIIEAEQRMISRKNEEIHNHLAMFPISNKKDLPLDNYDRSQKVIPPTPIGSYKNKIGIYDLASVNELCEPIKECGDIGRFSNRKGFYLEPGQKSSCRIGSLSDWSPSYLPTVPKVIGFRIAL